MPKKWMVVFTAMIVGLAVACIGGSEEPTQTVSSTKTPAERQTPAPTITTVSTPTPEAADELEQLKLELTKNRDLWESQKIEDYRFEYRRICFCPPEIVAPVEISVVDGMISDAVFLEGGTAAGIPDISIYETVEDLFDLIQDAIDRDAYSLLVTYDAEFGYPAEVSIDYDIRIADEEFGFALGNLRSGQFVSIEGHWVGVNKIAGQELDFMVDFVLSADGLSATIDIPLQGVKGLALSEVRLDGDRAHFELATGIGMAIWDGNLDGKTISGEFSQANFSGTFHLDRDVMTLNEPVDASFPYAVEEVIFNNGEINLAGTLTIPLLPGPHPALILLTGSGPQDRNEEIFGFKIFERIADRLTRDGIAVLRWDDRGVGGSTGVLDQATLEDLAQDAEAAIELLKGREEIDADKIGVLGHSEGGAVALLASTSTADIAFVVLVAGPAVSMEEILPAQLRLILEAAGATQEQIASEQRVQDILFQSVRTGQGWDEAAKEMRVQALANIASLPESERAQLGNVAEFVETLVKGQLAFVQTRAFKFFLEYDPGPDLEQMTVPVLALYGGLDIQVPADLNVGRLQLALETAGNKDFTIEVLPHANHLFQQAVLGTVEEYAILDKEFVPGFLDTIAEWLQKR